ncbi:MAG: PAS domain-containing protein [Verrucomicrobia bacterium]|nr:PAS domain-containing protein [Verrucomicrobiota bacterium]
MFIAAAWYRKNTQLVRLSLYASGLILLIFGFFEIVERAWLTDIEMSVRHMLQIVKAVLSSLAVAVFVSWMIIKNSPGFLEPAQIDEGWPHRSFPPEEERIKIYARWFIAMRWIAVLLAGILVLISVRLVEWLPRELWWPLALTVAVLAGSNVLYNLLLRWGRGIPMLLFLQGCIDLIILTVLLHFSGGIENPLSMMMIFHVIISGILLPRRQCYWMAGVASALFALLAWAEWADVVEHYTLQIFPHFRQQSGATFHPAHESIYVLSRSFLQAVAPFLTAYFVTTLAERLRENERRIETMAQQARSGQQLLEQALESSGAGLRVLDHQFQVCWANKRWKEWFVGPPGATRKGVDALNEENATARQALSDRQIRVTEMVLNEGPGASEGVGSDSNRRVFQVTTAPILDSSANIHQIVELAQDITPQKQTQAQMMRAGKLAAVGELAGQVAHEVNNPMAIISAKIRLLLSDHRQEMSPKIAQELNKVTDLADRVARIAQGLLSYCRPSPATRMPLDVRQPIRRSLAMIEQRARHSGVSIVDELHPELPPVKANSNEMEQIFLNLFLNALDAMPKGGRLRVSAPAEPVALRDGASCIAVVVADTGVGIPETIRDKIFEPFFTTKREGHGTGLGLPICLGLVRSHGGEIEVESEAGQGTRFTVKLPLAIPERKETAPPQQVKMIGTTPIYSASEATEAGQRILEPLTKTRDPIEYRGTNADVRAH